jgi:hypothetical protein
MLSKYWILRSSTQYFKFVGNRHFIFRRKNVNVINVNVINVNVINANVKNVNVINVNGS